MVRYKKYQGKQVDTNGIFNSVSRVKLRASVGPLERSKIECVFYLTSSSTVVLPLCFFILYCFTLCDSIKQMPI